jgi:hypothetical protein
MFTLTDYAMKRSGKLHGKKHWSFTCFPYLTITVVHNPNMWDNLDAQFLKHTDSVDRNLKSHGLPGIKKD